MEHLSLAGLHHSQRGRPDPGQPEQHDRRDHQQRRLLDSSQGPAAEADQHPHDDQEYGQSPGHREPRPLLHRDPNPLMADRGPSRLATDRAALVHRQLLMRICRVGRHLLRRWLIADGLLRR